MSVPILRDISNTKPGIHVKTTSSCQIAPSTAPIPLLGTEAPKLAPIPLLRTDARNMAPTPLLGTKALKMVPTTLLRT